MIENIYDRISYYDYLIRYDYYKLHDLKSINYEDMVMLNLAIAAGSNNLSPTNSDEHNEKIKQAHHFIYQEIQNDFNNFKPILVFPYNYSNLHHILTHNLVFAFGNDIIKCNENEQLQLLEKTYNSNLEVKISYEYYLLIRVLHYAKTGVYSKVANNTLNYIKEVCFPFFKISKKEIEKIENNFRCFYNERYVNLKKLKHDFHKYSNFYTFQFGMHFLGYMLHNCMLVYPKLWPHIEDIMSILRSIQLNAAKYLIANIYKIDKNKLFDFVSNVQHKKLYYY